MTAAPPDALDGYLAALDSERRAVHTALVGAVALRASESPRVHDFLFIPGQRHPRFEDSEEVFWRAVRQLMLVEPAGRDEVPVAWIGYDVANRFTGRREAQGFLLTDRRVVVKDQVDGVFGTATPRQFPFFVGQDGIAGSAVEIAGSVVASYDWDAARSLVDGSTERGLGLLLAELLVAILEALTRLRIALAPAPVAAADLRGRVRELGLSDAAKLPDDPRHVKHFAKLQKKLPLESGERVLLAFTGSTLAGVYGLVLTDLGVRSKDLGEYPVFTPAGEIVADAVRIDDRSEHRLLLAPGAAHELPATLSERQAAALATLVREWSEGKIVDGERG